MLKAILAIIEMIMRLWVGRAQPEENHAQKEVQNAKKVETNVERLPDGDAARLLKSKWRRGK